MGHKKNEAKQTGSMIHNEQGVALIYALVVMAVIVALALALLYGVGQVSLMTSSHRDQEDCYLQALTLSEAIHAQLTAASGGGIYDVAKAYMPDSDSDSTEESIQFTAEGLGDSYGRSVIRFQNGVEAMNESHDWESKQLSNQYLDLTVEVFGKRGGKESVTTRYRFFQSLDDDDMEYQLQMTDKDTNETYVYPCSYEPALSEQEQGHFLYTDNDSEKILTINRHVVTMEDAEQWSGTEQDGGVQSIRSMEIDSDSGAAQMVDVSINARLKLTRTRKVLGFDVDENGEVLNEYKGTDLKFQKINTR